MRANEDGQDLRNLSAVIARNAKRIRELEAALTDMTRQRDELLGAVQAWHGAEYSERIEFKLTDAMKYCTEWTASDRARDAEEQVGQAAAADEAMLRHGG